ncbi:DUF397 domain-containing protein [Streptomyces sp. TLI_185]|uniref:DUF397 domain-containing protein n=1 Tax=Streptomyces sp. TLI_185 TaxID=2485151 RepID=UPI000F4E0FA9|nr:DUF397 domain-containing protein [Streptomyces sp. TLI_185]RPF36715.1 uncharacterized protein DUF397 [Streptomyces sp. TLI_185]
MTTPHNWRKSSYSGSGDGNNCVEIANLPTRVAIRDSKAPSRGMISFPRGTFSGFISNLNAGTSRSIEGLYVDGSP